MGRSAGNGPATREGSSKSAPDHLICPRTGVLPGQLVCQRFPARKNNQPTRGHPARRVLTRLPCLSVGCTIFARSLLKNTWHLVPRRLHPVLSVDVLYVVKTIPTNVLRKSTRTEHVHRFGMPMWCQRSLLVCTLKEAHNRKREGAESTPKILLSNRLIHGGTSVLLRTPILKALNPKRQDGMVFF